MLGANRYRSAYRDKRKARRVRRIREWASWAACTAFAVLAAAAFVYCFGLRTGVVGGAMEPTLSDGQEVLIDRVAYRIFAPERGDVVAIRPEGDGASHDDVRRIAALPGDTVQMYQGRLLVNGEAAEGAEGPFDTAEAPEVTLGEDEYLVRADAWDDIGISAESSVDTVKAERILGKVWLAVGGGAAPRLIGK